MFIFNNSLAATKENTYFICHLLGRTIVAFGGLSFSCPTVIQGFNKTPCPTVNKFLKITPNVPRSHPYPNPNHYL